MARMKVLNGPSIRRMPIYLYWLSVMQARGEEFASTTQLAEYIDLEPVLKRLYMDKTSFLKPIKNVRIEYA